MSIKSGIRAHRGPSAGGLGRARLAPTAVPPAGGVGLTCTMSSRASKRGPRAVGARKDLGRALPGSCLHLRRSPPHQEKGREGGGGAPGGGSGRRERSRLRRPGARQLWDMHVARAGLSWGLVMWGSPGPQDWPKLVLVSSV